jgi:hypothetical protein
LLGRREKRGEKEKYGNQCINLIIKKPQFIQNNYKLDTKLIKLDQNLIKMTLKIVACKDSSEALF